MKETIIKLNAAKCSLSESKMTPSKSKITNLYDVIINIVIIKSTIA